MRKTITALIALAAGPALAQYGSAPSPPPRDLPQGKATAPAPPPASDRAEVLRAAACLAGRDARAAEVLLATVPGSNQERQAAAGVLRTAQRCLRLRAPLATSATIMRGAIAESLYEARFAAPPAPRTPALAAASAFRADAVAGRPEAAGLAAAWALSRCSVERDPARVRALLATSPGSAEESAAIPALNPVWVACVSQGTRLSVDRAGIRAMMAEDLYRWSVVQRDGPASPLAAAAPAN